MPSSGLSARHSRSILSILVLFITTFSPISLSPATAAPALVTCVNLQTGAERISRTGKCRTTQEAQANWHKNQSDSPIASGPTAKVINICSNKESSPVSYQVIRKKCARHQVTTIFSRSGALPAKPVIAEAVSFGHDSASLKLAQDPAASPDAPIAFYTITSTTVDTRTAVIVQSQKVYYWKDLSLAINTLQASTRYTFTVSATTADGTSPVSISSIPVTTPAYVPPAPAATTASLAVPAFSLSASAETKTVNTSITGYTITSTGGTIASYAISPAAPAGTTFNTSTGLISGTPTSTQSAILYTVTATNVTGSATQTFTLTVRDVGVYSIGDVGPAGGTIFYTSNSGFACGPTLAATCNYLELSTLLNRTLPWSIGSFPTQLVPSPGADKSDIGAGYRNTLSIVAQNGTYDTSSNAYEAGAAQANLSGGYSDWYLPSKDELQAIYDYNSSLPSPFTWDSGYFYNSSTEFSATNVWGIYFAPRSSMVNGVSKTDNNYFFAVRAF